MPISMSYFVVDPDLGPVEEFDFESEDDLAALLAPGREAGVEIFADSGELIVRDELDDLIAGLCIGGGGALQAKDSYTNVSFAGFDSTVISADGDTATFSSAGKTVTAPRSEAIAALQALAGRYAAVLKSVFPEDAERRKDIESYAGAASGSA